MNKLRRKTIVSSVLLVLSAIGAQGQNVSSADPPLVLTPIAVSREEVEDHRTAPLPILRFSPDAGMTPLLALVGIEVKVIVSPDGVVAFAHSHSRSDPPDAPAQITKEAEAAVKEMHFRPFERNGHPIWATFEERVAVLPTELKPLRHIPFPEVRDWKAVVITLTRTGCLGFCPSYSIQMHGDGTVIYYGTAYVAIQGRHQCAVSQGKVRELVDLFRKADYFSLQNKYAWNATDLPTYISTIEIDGQSKKLTDYFGLGVGMPFAVSDLEKSIDRLAEVKRWTEGNADTVRCLREEKQDLNSAEGARILVGIAERGNAEALRELVAAGAPLDGQDSMRQTPVMLVARRGNVEMLRILLEAGVAKKDARGTAAAIAMAIRFGKSDALKLLLSFVKTTDSEDTQGQTMLMLAAASGVPNVVDEILKTHSDVNARDKNDRTALMEAVSQYHDGAEAPEVNRAWVVRTLLEIGADPNLQDKDGNTALIDAAWDANAVLVLLQGGANINAQNKKGYTALINCGDPEVAWVLLANHADPSIRDAQGRTALEVAKQYNMKEKEAVLLTGKKP